MNNLHNERKHYDFDYDFSEVICIASMLLAILLLFEPSISAAHKLKKLEIQREQEKVESLKATKMSLDFYEKKHKDIIDIFENYNYNYIKESNKINSNLKEVTVVVLDNWTKIVNNILINYTSNVHGYIITSKTHTIDYFNQIEGKKSQYKTRWYTIKIPEDAKYADTLQKDISEYIEHLRKKAKYKKIF